MRRALFGLALLIGLLAAAPARADDAYITGYATALLEREFKLTGSKIRVQNGHVTIAVEKLGPVAPDEIQRGISRIPGVTSVDVLEGPEAMAAIPAAPPGAEAATAATTRPTAVHLFPPGLLFAPLHADPRWARFNPGFRRVLSGQGDFKSIKNVFYGNFGETFALYRNAAPLHGQWEIGIQAGAFTIFDVSSPDGSKDLINADYLAGLVLNYRTGDFSSMLRYKHVSTHLGDEFILRNPGVQRINLSFEELDWKLSYDVRTWLRFYGGAGVLVRREPVNLKRGTAQGGVEFSSPWTWFNGAVRPVTYVDGQWWERTQWTTGLSVLPGIQFENYQIGGRKGMFLFEYYNGPQPDGQFFTQHIQYFGAGVHLYF
jgi:hypothetical protein